MEKQRFFAVTYTKNWVEKQMDFIQASSHEATANKLPKKSKRVFNARFREIEKTGEYYRVTENKKSGKAFIFEII